MLACWHRSHLMAYPCSSNFAVVQSRGERRTWPSVSCCAVVRVRWHLNIGSDSDAASLSRGTIACIQGAFRHCDACIHATPLLAKPLPLDKMVVDSVVCLLRLNVPVPEILASNQRMITEHFDGHITTSHSRVLLDHKVCLGYMQLRILS